MKKDHEERKKQKKAEKKRRKKERKEQKKLKRKRKREAREAEKAAEAEKADQMDVSQSGADDEKPKKPKKAKTAENKASEATHSESSNATEATTKQQAKSQPVISKKVQVAKNAGDEGEDGSESSSAEPRKPRWKPDFSLFGEKLMPKQVDYMWGYYDSVEQVQELVTFLDGRGVRERALKANLEKRMERISYLMMKRLQQKRAVPVIPDGGRRSARTNSVPTYASSSTFLANFEVYTNHLAKDK